MKGNRLARGGDPMKTRSERRKEREARISKTNRAQRLRKRLARFRARDFAHQQDGHTTALMESYILRRKAERAEEKKRAAAAAAKNGGDATTEERPLEKGEQVKRNNKKKATAPAKGGHQAAHQKNAQKAPAGKGKQTNVKPQQLPLSSKKLTPRSLY